jgi:hypothetical protein
MSATGLLGQLLGYELRGDDVVATDCSAFFAKA